MEEEMISSSQQQLEDIPEVIHCIQQLLPVKSAVRTCILNKKWLHAWSTIPILRFHQPLTMTDNEKHERKHLEAFDATLLRYLRDNIPINKIVIEIDIKNQEMASLVENWIRSVASKSCLSHLYLLISVSIGSFTLPDEIFNSKNLKEMRVRSSSSSHTNSLCVGTNSLVKCVFLQELHLCHVDISEGVLDNLLSTCCLLKKISLRSCKGLKTIKIANLRFLYKLRIHSIEEDGILEIFDVPNLCSVSYRSFRGAVIPPLFNIPSVKELSLKHLVLNNSFFDMIEFKLPFLKSLTLDMWRWLRGRFDIVCVSLESLSLLSCHSKLIDIQVYAPKLNHFHYEGKTMPNLVFPATAPKKIDVVLKLRRYSYNGYSIFDRMRETLKLSSDFDIEIKYENFDFVVPLSVVNVDFVARNVSRLSMETSSGIGLWDRLPFFDAFFSICHPNYVVARRDSKLKDNNYFCKLMVREVLEKKRSNGNWSDDLRDVLIKNPLNGKWEMLTDSWRSFLDGPHHAAWPLVEFKLNWCSPEKLHA